jgi:proteasome lid subunit RPN8/RPN11
VACDLGSATPASISFPPEFWQKVEEIHTAEYPGLLRLGPFHSHPGYGVQPSGTDRATILTSFSRPHHVSIIYDPHDDQIGYTCWQGGDLLPSSGLFVYRHRRPDDLLSELMGAGSE